MTGPERFGKYELVRRLAFGGMAEIFLARLTGEAGFNKKVVVKRILPQFSSDPNFVQMFIDEAVIAARLTHPNIVQVYDFGEVDGTYYIAMEWVDGADLTGVVKHTRSSGRGLTAVEVAIIGEGICKGLSYAHNFVDDAGTEMNIVHRDISPHNVMVSRSGESKVMDFGIAKAEERATKTKTGMIKGKIAYMAPEQASGLKIDKRADQFAVGLVLWECLTGARHYTGDSDMEMLRQVVNCETRPIAELNPDVPPEITALVMRALSREPADRFADLSELEHELSRFRFSLGQEGAARLGPLIDEVSPRRPSLNISAQVPAGRRTLALDDAPSDDDKTEIAQDKFQPSSNTSPTGDPWVEHDGETAATAGWQGGSDGDLGEAPTQMTPSEPVALYQRPTGEVLNDAGSTDRVGSGPVGTGKGKFPMALVGLGLGGVIVGLVAVTVIRRSGEPTPITTSVQEVVPLNNAPTRGTLLITSEPAGASIAIQGMGVGLKTPAPIPDQQVGTPLQIELTLEGYQTLRQVVTLRGAQQDVAMKLMPVVTALAPASAVPEEQPEPPATTKIRRPRKQKAPKAVKAEPGQLSLRTTGAWAEVFLGKRKLGTTPLNAVDIPSGKQKLRLVNLDKGLKKTIFVKISPGEHTKQRIDF